MELVPVPILHGASLLIGLLCGSFVTAFSYRLPRGEDFVFGRSRCPKCGHDLAVVDLFPILSWLVNRGRCRHCQASVSVRYPLIEFTCGALFVAASVVTLPEDPTRAVLLWLVVIVLLTLSIIDLEHDKLPNALVVSVIGLALAINVVDGRSLSLTAAVCLSAFVLAYHSR